MTNNPEENGDPTPDGIDESSGLVKSQCHETRDPADGPKGGSLEPLVGRCGAKLRNSVPDKFCKKPPVAGRDRCRLHGGATPRGVLSVNYKGRGYSKDLPARLMERMMDSIDDPDLTSLRSEIALVDARLGELLKNLSQAGTDEAWSTVKTVRDRLRYVVDRPDADDREVTLDLLTVKLDAAVEVMRSNQTGWSEIYALIDRRRRTVGVELKREESQEHTLRHAQALHFFQALLVAIHEEVEDVQVKAALATRISKLMNRPPPTALVSPSDLPVVGTT